MTYDEAVKFIQDTGKLGWKPGLERMARLLELMGEPQKKLKYVHVAGTSGKGSVVAFISSILIEAGLKVGTFISPSLVSLTERIAINGREIGQGDFTRIIEDIKSKIDVMLSRGVGHPTEFEIITAAAFQYYYEKACDLVVLEVGLGGRLDSTNVIERPLLSVITPISWDHMNFLGDTLEKIAYEKAGIIKEKGQVLVSPQQESVLAVLKAEAEKKKACLHMGCGDGVKIIEYGLDGQVFDYKGYKSLEIRLLGDHQADNAALAIDAAEILKAEGIAITEENIRAGLKRTRWPGRIEVLSKAPVFIADGAHNPEKVQALKNALLKYFPGNRKTFIMGVLADKDYETMVKEMASMADRFIAITPASPRALPAEKLANYIKFYCKNVSVSDTIEHAVVNSLQNATSDDVICAFGSLSFIGEIKEIISSRFNKRC